MFAVIGTTTVDIYLTGADRLPCPGDDEFTAESVAFLDQPVALTLGGNGANSAYVLAGLGERTALCSVLGRDFLGELARGWLEERGVSLEGVLRSGSAATACTAVATDRSLRRLTLHHPGCSPDYDSRRVPVEIIAGADALLVTGYHLLPLFRVGGYRRILSAARGAGAMTALDLGPIVEPVATIAELAPLLPLADYVIGNERELLACTDAERVGDAASELEAAGARTIVIKRGRSGASLRGNGACVDVSGFAVETTGTVGAGDAFNAGFLHSRRRGDDPEQALRFASAVAACVVAAPRGILDSPDPPTVERFLRQHRSGSRG